MPLTHEEKDGREGSDAEADLQFRTETQALTTVQNEVMAPRGGACRTARATAEQAVLPAWSRLSPPAVLP